HGPPWTGRPVRGGAGRPPVRRDQAGGGLPERPDRAGGPGRLRGDLGGCRDPGRRVPASGTHLTRRRLLAFPIVGAQPTGDPEGRLPRSRRPPSRRLAGTGVPMTRPIEDSVVVITGASSGIGRATAQEFARRGAAVV